MCTLFEGSEKVYDLYTNLNVDNYGLPIKVNHAMNLHNHW